MYWLKKILQLTILIILIATNYSAFSQQKPVLSQYMFNGLVINPAYAGVHEHLNVTALYRNQWVNFEGAPETSTFSAHSGLKGKNIGVGFLASNDEVGVHNDLSFYGYYAYKIKFKNGSLSMGLQGGFNHLKSDYTILSLKDPGDSRFGVVNRSLKFNFGTGIYYSNKTSYIGFSIPYIRKKRFVEENLNTQNFEDSRYYYLTAGQVLDLTPKIKIKPSVLLRLEENMPIAYDLNVNFYLEDVLNIGASYRSGESLITLFELKVSDYIRLGYAFDWVISDINTYTAGTHELMLNYRLNLFAPRKHRMCPGPYYY